jgi:hypothetical protein
VTTPAHDNLAHDTLIHSRVAAWRALWIREHTTVGNPKDARPRTWRAAM